MGAQRDKTNSRGEALPTLGTYEVEVKDGYVVAAHDASGGSWSSDDIVDFGFNDEGFLVYARYADGSVWIADSSDRIDEFVDGLRSELDAKTPAKRSVRRAAMRGAITSARTAVGVTVERRRERLVRATNQMVFRASFAAVSASGKAPSTPSSYPRVLTHAVVLGAVLVPMSITVASAQTAPMQQPRVTIPLTLDASATTPLTDDALRAAAVAAVTPEVPSAAVVDAIAPPPPPSAPVRPFQEARPAAGSGGHFPWGWRTWYVSSKRYVPWMGNAIEWYGNARSMGFAEGQKPQVGAIMVTRESWWGHVAYVESVDADGGFTVSEMNYKGFGITSTRHFAHNPSALVGFIY
jgi:hypothetical protein